MNKVILIGRLTREPEVSYVGSNNTAKAGFSVAVNRSYKNKDGKYDADFINCTAYGKCGELLEKYWHKGDMIIVEGEWRTGSYEKDGQRIYTNECNVNRVEFCGGKNNSSQNNSQPDQKSEDSFVNVDESATSDIPFFS